MHNTGVPERPVFKSGNETNTPVAELGLGNINIAKSVWQVDWQFQKACCGNVVVNIVTIIGSSYIAISR